MVTTSRRAFLATVPLLALAGCGFRPLYGEVSGRVTVAELALITVDPIPDRLGLLLRNHLLNRLTPLGVPAHPRYRLHVDLSQSTAALGIQTDARITRYNLNLKAEFALTDVASGEAIYRDKTRTVGSYDVQRSEYGTLVSEQSTAKSAALDVGDRIATLLALFFDRQG